MKQTSTLLPDQSVLPQDQAALARSPRRFEGSEFAFFVSTALGLESVLLAELQALGITNPQLSVSGVGGVSFQGSLRSAYQVCLWSRVASRVFLILQTFQAKNPEELYKGVRQVAWRDHLALTTTFAVQVTHAKHSWIAHSHYAALRVKDAVVDQFREDVGARPSVDAKKPQLRIHVHLEGEDQVSVGIDLSGESLHQRGYRLPGAQAPLKENLAAGLLLLMGWPLLAAVESGAGDRLEGGPEEATEILPASLPMGFIDPMCGSGTLVIEAAWIADRVAPGLLRTQFGFQGWLGYDAELWASVRADAEGQIRKSETRIVGYDADPRSVQQAQQCVVRAGLQERVHIECKPWGQVTHAVDEPHGLILVNPPYGWRLGDHESLLPLYQSLGDHFKQRFKGWKAGVFTGSASLAKAVGLKPRRRRVLFNGAIECRLLDFELY